LGTKKVITGQTLYPNEYYAQQPVQVPGKNNRIRVRSMSRTELSEEKAKTKTNQAENIVRKGP